MYKVNIDFMSYDLCGARVRTLGDFHTLKQALGLFHAKLNNGLSEYKLIVAAD